MELEHKLDPRRPINDHPIAAVALAFAVGVALGTRGRGNGSVPAVAHEGAKSDGLLSVFVHRLASTAASAASARLIAGLRLDDSTNQGAR
ncbi:MAG: hypothetical protein M3081_11310 [Gemmatimonadota bacterium]|nr:hypothetical protein [Gemmatimonadota bacterium]